MDMKKSSIELDVDFQNWTHNPHWFPRYCPHDPTECCYPCFVRHLLQADGLGDGPLVNAMCAFGRRKWGSRLHW